MKKQFDEISSMLDSIRGGRSSNGLFDINVDTEATELCSTNCSDNCGKNIVGQTTGEKKGTLLPDPPIKPIEG